VSKYYWVIIQITLIQVARGSRLKERKMSKYATSDRSLQDRFQVNQFKYANEILSFVLCSNVDTST
jgi:hypothetical protein